MGDDDPQATRNRLEGWRSDVLSGGVTTERLLPRRLNITIRVDSEGDMEIEMSEEVNWLSVPIEVIANHLRLIGWTVAPPDEVQS